MSAPPPRAAVLVTGSEILLGRTQDRNSGFLARALDGQGVRVARFVAVDDAAASIEAALRALLDDGIELVVCSGGLGPTHDDRTVEAVAAATGRPLVVDEPTLARIDEIVTAFARARGADPALYARGNRKQATVPAGAEVLAPVGTAPGLVVPAGASVVVVLPGPPFELGAMWPEAARSPLVAPLLGRGATARRILRIFGVPESAVADAFEALGGDDAGTETTICASRMEIEVLVRHDPASAPAAERLVAGLRERFGRAVYAEGASRLEELVLAALRARGLTVATAESCTAGLVASRLATVPGASEVLRGGVVAYANDVKRDVLGVSDALLAEHGAVSAESALAMAAGARRALAADVGVAVTGVAGPGGGTAAKPVGLIHVAASAPGAERQAMQRLPGDRDQVREWAATMALQTVRIMLEESLPGH